MSIFNAYSDYYDLLYSDKDYDSEALYIHKLIKKNNKNASSILNLGCGTGNHDFYFAKNGYNITGIDLSESNIKKAKAKLSKLNEKDYSLNFVNGDIRNIRLNKTYDVVISLFHVMSYQISNEDVKDVLSTAKAHLNDNGIMIFDLWYGPAVLTDRPTIRIKHIENENLSIRRIAEPEIFPNKNIVNVNYFIIIKDKSNNKIKEVSETHKMRYFFKTEIDEFINQANFNLISFTEWMNKKTPGFDTWNVCVVLSNKNN